MTTLEEAKAFLKREAPDGTNLYDHLSDVLLKILVERPDNLTDCFEYVSSIVKQQRFVPATSGDNESAVTKQNKATQEAWTTAALDLLKIKNEEEAATTAPAGVADLLDEANMFEWAGIGFSKGEIFRIAVALQRLAQIESSTTMRFWGKVLGRGADYYVAEGQVATPNEPEDAAVEEGITGANKFAYWAMKDDGTYVWVRLPNIQRTQILAARQLRRFVGADLNGSVTGHPPFPGKEMHYLRAQIARITAGTVLAPAGFFQASEEGEIDPTEESELKTAEQLEDLSNWVHFSKEINATYGRMTPMPPKTNADGEEVPWENEEFAPLLRSPAEDTTGSWRVNRCPSTLIPSIGEIAVVRSLVWPGAVSLAVGKKFLNVYVGHAVKFSTEPYQRCLPKPLETGFGVTTSEDPADGGESRGPTLHFTGLSEQADILDDPTPPAAEE